MSEGNDTAMAVLQATSYQMVRLMLPATSIMILLIVSLFVLRLDDARTEKQKGERELDSEAPVWWWPF